MANQPSPRTAIVALAFFIGCAGTTAHAATAAPAGVPSSDDRLGVRWGAMPISNYTSDRGFTYGAMAERFDYNAPGTSQFKSVTSMQFQNATRGAADAYIDHEETNVSPLALRLGFALDYYRNPFQRYYGAGADSVRTEAAEKAGHYYYTDRGMNASITARKRVAEDLDLQTGLGLYHTEFESQNPTSPYAIDYGGSRRFNTYPVIRLGLIQEKRNSEFIPSKGYYWAASSAVSPARGGSWARLDLDYRRYDSIIGDRYLWVATQARLTSTTGNTPLDQKARLGSIGTVRGLVLNRYIGDESASLRTELRSVVIRWNILNMPFKSGCGVFLDSGKLGQGFNEFVSSDFRWAWGISLFGSYFTDDFLGTMDLGFAHGETELYLRLGHAF